MPLWWCGFSSTFQVLPLCARKHSQSFHGAHRSTINQPTTAASNPPQRTSDEILAALTRHDTAPTNTSCSPDLCNSPTAEESLGAQRLAPGVVLLLLVNGDSYVGQCTGTMINNLAGRQYVLTAYHCLQDDQGRVSEDWPSTWSAVLHYGTSCDGNNTAPPTPMVIQV